MVEESFIFSIIAVTAYVIYNLCKNDADFQKYVHV